MLALTLALILALILTFDFPFPAQLPSGRFDVNSRAPEHVSVTSIVVRATDIHTHIRLGGVHSGGTTGVHVSVSNDAMMGLNTGEGSGDEVVIKLIRNERDFRRELDQVRKPPTASLAILRMHDLTGHTPPHPTTLPP